jgi:hypothetical protein
MQADDVINIALERFESSIEEKSRRENLNIDPSTEREIEKIVKDALHSKREEIKVTVQSQPVDVDQINRATEELVNSTIDQAKKERRSNITSGDAILAFMDLGIKGCIFPFCKS